jgi:serine/threonine-protein kinase
MALEPAKLSDFKLAGSLGSGATARVYEATQVVTGRPVAIKMMEDSGSTPEMRERFAREAILLSGVQSRHVSKILGFGFEKGQPFLVLERLAGETLDAKLRRDGPPQPKVAVKWIEQLIVGIRDCHDAKIIHRDIKPSNIFLHRDAVGEMVKVIDFGVARLRELTEDGSGALTSANHLIGSMGYMAPEQFTNAKGVHFTADLYAIGVVIFRTLTGRLPFVSRNLHAVIRMKSEQVVPAISSMPGMPQNPLLDWFVQKATHREPNSRFKNAREMLDQWWDVMSSFEDQGLTEISRRAIAIPPMVPPSSEATLDDDDDTDDGSGQPDEPSSPDMLSATADDEDRTIHRPNRFPSAAPSSPSPSIPASSSSERTIQRAMSFPLPAESEDAPHTIRQPDETAAFADDADPFDLPTKSDPNLRKLVERELALQKARREGGK